MMIYCCQELTEQYAMPFLLIRCGSVAQYCVQVIIGSSRPKGLQSVSWWRHEMETFSALLAICAENSPVPCEFTAERPVTRSFDVLFDLRLNKRLSKQWWGWWFETPSYSLWRHRNVVVSPLPHPMQTSCQLDPEGNLGEIWIKVHFYCRSKSRNYTWKCRLQQVV